MSNPDLFKYPHKTKIVPVYKTKLTNIIKNEGNVPDRHVVLSHATHAHQHDFMKDLTITFDDNTSQFVVDT